MTIAKKAKQKDTGEPCWTLPTIPWFNNKKFQAYPIF